MLSELIAEKYKLRRYIQGKADGKLEGIAEANRLWLDWIK